MKRSLRLVLAAAMALLLLGGLTPSASALEVRSGDNIVIAAGEVFDDDLVLAGNAVTFNGTVNGNLIAAGNRVEVNGTVNGTLIAAGQSLVVNGAVRDSVYAVGMGMVLGGKASVGRNVAFGGFGAQADAGSKVGRDLLVGGYQLVQNGEVARDLRFAGGAMELNGKVARNVWAEVDAPGAANPSPYVSPFGNMPSPIPAGLRVAPDAVVGGKLTYASPVNQSSNVRIAPAGGIVFEQRVPQATAQRREPGPLDFVWGRAQEFMSLLLLGLLAAWAVPQWLSRASAALQARPLNSAAWGAAWLIGGFLLAIGVGIAIVVVGIVLGFVTLGGLTNAFFGLAFTMLALAFGLFLLAVAFGAKLVCAHLFGRLILRSLYPAMAEHRYVPLLLGIVVYVLIASIPFVDWLVVLAVTIVGLGAIWNMLRGGGTAPAALAAPPPVVPSMPRPVMG